MTIRLSVEAASELIGLVYDSALENLESSQGDQIADAMDAVEADPSDQPTDINTLIFRRQPLELGTLY